MLRNQETKAGIKDEAEMKRRITYREGGPGENC
jgi:hypothetical protein